MRKTHKAMWIRGITYLLLAAALPFLLEMLGISLPLWQQLLYVMLPIMLRLAKFYLNKVEKDAQEPE